MKTCQYYAYSIEQLDEIDNEKNSKRKDSQKQLVLNIKNSNVKENEKWHSIFLQILIPFLVAGLGMIAAGQILKRVQVINYNILPFKIIKI